MAQKGTGKITTDYIVPQLNDSIDNEFDGCARGTVHCHLCSRKINYLIDRVRQIVRIVLMNTM